jgi:hypothetical protein
MWEYFGEAIDGDHATEENLVAALAACLDRYTQDYTVRALFLLFFLPRFEVLRAGNFPAEGIRFRNGTGARGGKQRR